LDFKILDASAFYAGIPFSSLDQSFTTSKIYDEINHIKKNHDAINILIETKKLQIMDPSKEDLEFVIKMAKKTGDYQQLSKQDLSVIALSHQLKGELVSDDFAISNLAKNLGIKVSSLMTLGIKDVGKWIHYCPGCKKNFSSIKECPICGNQLKRKLLKEKSSIV